MCGISVGDVVKATAGRDKDKFFLVIDIEGGFALIVDGKTRKVGKPKRKNVKHLIKAAGASMKSDAEKIVRGEPFGNERLKKAIVCAIQKN